MLGRIRRFVGVSCRKTKDAGRRGPLSPYFRRLAAEPLEDRRLLSAGPGNEAMELFSISPALFVENQGQWADESVRFVHQGDGANVAMTDAGPVFQLFRSEPKQEADARLEFQTLFRRMVCQNGLCRCPGPHPKNLTSSTIGWYNRQTHSFGGVVGHLSRMPS